MRKIKMALASLFRNLWRFMRGEPLLVAEWIKQNRLDHCRECIYFSGKICHQCYCVMDVKAALRAEKCPLDRW